MSKLADKIMAEYGLTMIEALEQATYDSVAIGVCRDCGELSDSVEPDCTEGYCDSCDGNRVVSILVLGGFI